MDKILSPLYFCNETRAFPHFTWGVARIWHFLTNLRDQAGVHSPLDSGCFTRHVVGALEVSV